MYLIVWLSFYYYIFFVSFCLTTPKRECSCTFRTFWPNRSLEVQLRKIIFHLLQSVCLLILFDTQTSFTAIPIYDEEHSVYHKSQFNFFFFRFSWNFIQFPPILREILYLAWCWLQPNTELESIGRLFYEVSL